VCEPFFKMWIAQNLLLVLLYMIIWYYNTVVYKNVWNQFCPRWSCPKSKINIGSIEMGIHLALTFSQQFYVINNLWFAYKSEAFYTIVIFCLSKNNR